MFTARYGLGLYIKFCPHSVFMCFVWISRGKNIISLCSINWLVFISETECVYCAVRSGSLYIIQVFRSVFVFKRVNDLKLNQSDNTCSFCIVYKLTAVLNMITSIVYRVYIYTYLFIYIFIFIFYLYFHFFIYFMYLQGRHISVHSGQCLGTHGCIPNVEN